MSKKREPFSISKRIESFKYAFAGIYNMIRYEHNAWIHVVAAVVAIAGGLLLDLNRIEWLFVAGAICLVFALELINTAIENLADAITTERNPYIKQAKDLAAGAVLIGAFFALVVAGVIIYNHWEQLF
jgi:diacylglycerol kinase